MKMFEDYIYEVRGCNDPIDGDIVKFETKVDALQYADLCPNCTVYMVEVDEDPNTGCVRPTGEEIQLRGPKAEKVYSDPNIPNSCEADVTVFVKDDLEDDLDEAVEVNMIPEDMTDEELAEKLYAKTKGLKEERSVEVIKSKLKSIIDT